MNTRLQVEHPVTEMITGIDLVKEQISIADGNKISFNQSDITIRGHAIESRIYAEDPDNNFLPSTGKILEYIEPAGPGVRVDGGFIAGSEISLYYDPLISKLVCYGKDRNTAIKKMQRALNEYHIAGLITNIYFLSGIFIQKDFYDGRFDINYVEREFLDKQKDRTEVSESETIAALFSAILKKESALNGKVLTGNSKQSMNRWTEQFDE
jgi:acetyl/propionyl-CoA carboxylase alpha subunit